MKRPKEMNEEERRQYNREKATRSRALKKSQWEDRILVSYEESLKLPDLRPILVLCSACKAEISTTPRYVRMKGKPPTCLTCLNRERGEEVKRKIGKSVSEHLADERVKQQRSEKAKQMISDGTLRLPTERADPKLISEISKRLWESPEYRKRQQAGHARIRTAEWKAKMSETMRKKWENDATWRNKLIDRWKNPISTLNLTVSGLLNSLGVEHTMEHEIGPYSFDIFIPSHRILLELNGEYWHSLPKAIRNDKGKATYIEKWHPELKLISIWEIEFGKEGRLQYLIRSMLGIDTRELKPIDFDNCKVEIIQHREAQAFYGAFHYLGSARGGTHYGVMNDGILIGCCTFSPFQRNEQASKYKGAIELSRFCLHPDYQVKNFGSWFMSRALKLIGKTVVTYADTTRGHDGTLYKACNFEFSHEVEPDYWYVDQNNWSMHKRTVWGRAVKMGMSERDYAEKHGLSKRWGSKKLCFVYNRR